jgi:Zn-finger nucleic acid-binding protein
MDVYTIEGIEIDVCPKTGGVWLDFDEIIPILQKNDRILLERRDRNSTNGGFTWLDFVATILSGISF